MKKILALMTVALFLGAMSVSVLAQDPPKKEKTECKKKSEACSKDSTKCAAHGKAGCCKGEKKPCEKK
jgi:hypothetical protein